MRPIKDFSGDKYERLLDQAVSDRMHHQDQYELLCSVHQARLARAIILIVALHLFGLVVLLLGSEFGIPSIYLLIVVVLGIVSGILLFRVAQDSVGRKTMARGLLKKNVRPSVCVVCSYELRGAVSDLCPECGEPLAPLQDEQA